MNDPWVMCSVAEDNICQVWQMVIVINRQATFMERKLRLSQPVNLNKLRTNIMTMFPRDSLPSEIADIGFRTVVNLPQGIVERTKC